MALIRNIVRNPITKAINLLTAGGMPTPPSDDGMPIGTVLPYAGIVEPPGWIFARGQTLNATTTPKYEKLFNIIGTTYGGSGITSFSVPDLRGRVAVGRDNMGGATAGRITNAGSSIVGTTLGASGGSQDHTLSVTQIPAHGHSVSGSTGSGSNVAGALLVETSTTGSASGWAGHTPNRTNTLSGGSRNDYPGQAHTHSVSGTAADTGGGLAHNNTQPSLILNYIIKY